MEKNILEGIKDPKFVETLQSVIAEVENERKSREKTAGSHGNRLKSTPLLRILEEGKLNTDFLFSEFEKIANKESSLPAGQRKVVRDIVLVAARRTVLIKQAERARKIEAKANARVEAEEKAKEENRNTK